ncbi:MAG TPA: hypothetical protein VGQ36_08140 [Thermoanaerobaculia bacterium]|jgi:hypothetical protein|nr:hypothetical protein [Thermoanaerobaculia bacterium]
MTITRTAVLFLLALPLAADPLGDVRAAVGKLTAREPIRATYEYQRTVVNEGKFGDANFAGKAVVELEGNDSGYHIVFPRTLLDQVEREKVAKIRNPEQETPTANALREIEPVETADALDFAPTLIRLLDGSKVVSDAAGTWQGKPARVLVVRVPDRLSKDDAGKMKIGENRLTLWLGSDLVPLAAEHLFNAKLSFLIFRAELKEKKSWHLARVADRLVRTRYEAHQNSSGMGQKGNETVIATLRVH